MAAYGKRKCGLRPVATSIEDINEDRNDIVPAP